MRRLAALCGGLRRFADNCGAQNSYAEGCGTLAEAVGKGTTRLVKGISKGLYTPSEKRACNLYNHRNFSVLLFLEHVSIGSIGTRACELLLCCFFLGGGESLFFFCRANGKMAIFSNAEKFRCLYSHYAEEVRHASRNADSACPFLPSRQYKTGHAESAFRDACRTSSGHYGSCMPSSPKEYISPWYQ